MIILDEQLSNRRMVNAIAGWYRGAVLVLTELRPDTIIKDDAIPALLRSQRKPTFVTINVSHFWQRVPIDERFCVVCFALPDERLERLPSLLRLLFRNPDFSTKRQRGGHVFRINIDEEVRFYRCENPQVHVFRL